MGNALMCSILTPITAEGNMEILVGSDVDGTVKEAQKAGKFKGGVFL